MSLYRRFETNRLPSFVSTNTHDRCGVFTSRANCRLLIRLTYDIRSEEHFQLLAFAIMPDHLHMVLVPASVEVGRIMQLIKGRFAREYNLRKGQTGSIWQSRCHERTLKSEAALARAVQYVHNNPVAGGLAANEEEYDWSTASGKFAIDLEAYLGQAEA